MAQSIYLNMIPNTPTPRVYLSQYDVGETIDFILFYDAMEYTPPVGATVKVQGTKPSGFGYTVTATVDDNVASIEITEDMTGEAGNVISELVVTESGNIIGSKNFIIEIEKSPHPNGIIDGNAEEVIPELTQLVERVEDAASSVLDRQTVTNTLPAGSQATYSFDEETNTQTFGIPQGEAGAGAVDVTASAYSSSKTYAVGDYVIHNDYLYRCTTAITTAEAWTSGHWTQVLLGNEVSDVKSELSEIEGIFYGGKQQITFPTSFSGAINIGSITGSILTGGHNIVDYIGLTDGVYTLNGITFSVSGNEITISGTATGAVYFNLGTGTIAGTATGLNIETDYSLPAIEYSVGAIFDGVASGVTFGVRSRVSGNIGVAGVNTPSFTAMYDHATWGHLYIYVANGTALPNGGKLYIGIVPSSVSNPLYFYSENNAITEISNAGTATLGVYSIASGAVEAYATNTLDAKYKRKYLRYVQGSGADQSTERLEIYIPSIVGYIRYDFLHTVYAARHADVWRIGYAYAVHDDFTERFALTTQGEWECALHLKDRSDFSGGYAHGDEIVGNIVFFVDGVPTDITEYATYTAFDKLDIVQVSDLYDPNDGETVIAKHGSKHVFGDSEVRIDQSIIWEVSETLTWCYLAMFPPAKAVTNKLYTNKDFNIINVDGTTTSIKNATKCSIYSADSAFMADFNIGEYPKGIDNTADYFMTTDNNGGIYNKCYYVISGVGNPVTAIGEEWKSETIYKLNIDK